MADTKQLIPKLLFQTCETAELPPGMKKATETWRSLNSEYEYRFFDDRSRRAFIDENFNEEVSEAYASCVPGAYRADIWRYCVLYIHGGVYVDAGMVCLEPLSSVIKPTDRQILTLDSVPGAIANAFIATVPRDQLISNTIALAVKRVLTKDYGCSSIYPTGPYCLGDILNRSLGQPPFTPFELPPNGVVFAGFLNYKKEDDKWSDAYFYIKTIDGVLKFALYRYEGIETERKMFQKGACMTYGDMWLKRICF